MSSEISSTNSKTLIEKVVVTPHRVHICIEREGYPKNADMLSIEITPYSAGVMLGVRNAGSQVRAREVSFSDVCVSFAPKDHDVYYEIIERAQGGESVVGVCAVPHDADRKGRIFGQITYDQFEKFAKRPWTTPKSKVRFCLEARPKDLVEIK